MLLACALGLLLATPPAGAVAPNAAPAPTSATADAGPNKPANAASANNPASANLAPADPVFVNTPASVDEPASDDSPAREANRETRVREAAGAFAARRYPQAAREYEALYAEFDEPGFLLAAGRSRLAAGHRAHAVAYLGKSLASGLLTASDTQVAYGELEAAQRSVTPVTLRIELPADLDHVPQLSAEYVASPEIDPRPPLEFPLPTGSSPAQVLLLQLDAGTWRLRVDDPALASAELVVEVQAQPGDDLQLDLRPHGHGPGSPRLRLVGVLAGVGVATLGAGIGLTIVGDRAVRRTLDREAGTCLEQPDCRDILADITTLRSAGAGILGAGAGATIAGLTGLAREPQLRRRLWLAELAVGGVAVAGGSIAVALAARDFNDEAVASGRPAGDPEVQARVERRTAQHTAAAAGLGLGSGLVFAASIALLRSRPGPQRHIIPALGFTPGRGLELAVSGRF